MKMKSRKSAVIKILIRNVNSIRKQKVLNNSSLHEIFDFEVEYAKTLKKFF